MKKRFGTIFTKEKMIHCILLFVVVICFLSITTVYSALYTTMDISGTAYARVEADVRITDFRLASANNATSSFEEFGKSHVVTEVDLIDSTSTITYYLEITNYGSVDVGIFDITGLPDGVSYSIKDYNLHDKICNDSGKCNSFITKTYEITLSTISNFSGSVQLNFDFRTYHNVIYTYIDNMGYPVEVIDGGDLSITFNEELERVQVLSNGNELGYYRSILNGTTITFNNVTSDVEVTTKAKVARLVSGTLDQIGSEVCVKDECFYIISNDGETLTLLSKYNLLVGNRCNSGTTAVPLDNPTGKQDSTARGFLVNEYPYIGTTLFASSSHQGINLSDYDGSIVKDYVDEYSAYLSTLGVMLNNARLITHDELLNLGCSSEDNTCSTERSWLYSTSYWTMTVYDESHVWNVSSRNLLGTSGMDYAGYLFGVRPVIEISVDEIKPFIGVVSGDLDTVGSEVCIDKECFYVISSDDDTVTMLAMYNLYAGGSYNATDKAWTAYGDEATGIQDETMLGHNNGSPYNGTTVFATTAYWSSSFTTFPAYVYDSNSSLYNYVQKYGEYLKKSVTLNEIRLINVDELEAIGCERSLATCRNAPSWVNRSAYWTGSAHNSTGSVYYVARSNFSNNGMGNAFFGIRPVIVVDRDILSS